MLTITDNLLTIGNKHGRPGTALTALRGVVIHYNGEPGGTLNGVRGYFEGGSEGRYVSAHYGIDCAGKVQRWVPESERAMHCGSGNAYYIGIENLHPRADGQFTPETRAALVELAADILRRRGVFEVKRHFDITGKDCPLYYVKNPMEWDKLVADICAEVVGKPAAAAPSDWAKIAWEWAKAKGLTDGSRPKDGITRQEAMQLLYNFSRM